MRRRNDPFLPRKVCALAPRAWALCLGLLGLALVLPSGCAVVRPWQRERLASPAMQFVMSPITTGLSDSVTDITEGGSFPSAGPGSAGAGCGCH